MTLFLGNFILLMLTCSFFIFICVFFLRFFGALFSLHWIFCNITSVLCFGFWPQGMWDIRSLTRDWTCTPCIGRQSLNHWTSRKVPVWFWFCKNSYIPWICPGFSFMLLLNNLGSQRMAHHIQNFISSESTSHRMGRIIFTHVILLLPEV